jgi:hypothetical protein
LKRDHFKILRFTQSARRRINSRSPIGALHLGRQPPEKLLPPGKASLEDQVALDETHSVVKALTWLSLS